MNLNEIFTSSFKYPFGDLKHLICFFVLFALLLVLPAGLFFNQHILLIIGFITLAVFCFIFPGLRIMVIKSGIDQSSQIPFKIGHSVVNSLKLIILHIAYITIPTVIVFLILVFATGVSDYPMKILMSLLSFNFPLDLINDFLTALEIIIIVPVIVNWLFSIIYLIAKARLSNHNSLIQALKIHKVFGDIKKIGFGKFLAWYFVMAVIMTILNLLAFGIMMIPYAGLFIAICFILPVLSLIYYYSLGLLYSDFSGSFYDDEFDLDKFEHEIQRLKYLG